MNEGRGGGKNVRGTIVTMLKILQLAKKNGTINKEVK